MLPFPDFLSDHLALEFVCGLIAMVLTLFDMYSLFSVLSGIHRELKERATADVIGVDEFISHLGAGEIQIRLHRIRRQQTKLDMERQKAKDLNQKIQKCS